MICSWAEPCLFLVPDGKFIKETLMCRHCEERSDEAISKCLILNYEIAALRSQ